MTELNPVTKPLVAIIGRPNVGKSTLFNRLVGKQSAIVSDVEGTTRDRVMSGVVWDSQPFILVDTGGLALFPETDIWIQVKAQVELAINEADVIILVVDTASGLTAADNDVAELLRMTSKPVVLAANKSDNQDRASTAVEFYELGLGTPVPISAYHNAGIDDLMSQVVEMFPSNQQIIENHPDLKLAIVGRTNVGKSALLNAITDSERSIVSDQPGTTRDSIDSILNLENKSILLIDTAGIRRRGKIGLGIERYSVLRSIRAIDRSDVATVVIDASELGANQDAHVANYVADAFKGLVITVNKWDLARNLRIDKNKAIEIIRNRWRFASYAPICFTSALHNRGMKSLLETVEKVYSEWTKGVPRYDLSRTIMNAVSDHPPSPVGRRSLKIYGVTQDDVAPPSFTFYVNRSDMVHFSYRRYLENSIRKIYGFEGCPLRMRFKGRRDN